MESIPALLAGLEDDREAEEENRYRDICLVIQGYKRNETLIKAGGRWDAIDKRWCKQEPERAHIIMAGPGQEPFLRWGGRFLVDYRNGHEVDGFQRLIRTRVLLAQSGRRGAKTHGLQMFQWAMAVDIPLIRGRSLVCWTIHVSHQEEEEYFDNLKGDSAIVPPGWYRWRARLQRYELVHGSYVQMVSADTPQTTKRGKVDIAFVNEAQKQKQAMLTNLLYGVADRGGLAILAANPNDSLTGEWVAKFKKGVDEGTLPHAESFYFDPKLNPFIDQQARSDVDDIVKLIDPDAYKRDSEGEWLPVGGRVYYDFSARDRRDADGKLVKQGCVATVPQVGMVDVTREITRRRLGRSYDWVAGNDVQGKPHIIGVFGKFFTGKINGFVGTLDSPILWICKELVVDKVHEPEFLDHVDAEGYLTTNTHWVLDASSWWQDSTHSKNGVHTIDYFKQRGWVCKPPQEKKSTRGEFPANPKPASLRYGLSNRLLATCQTMIDPSCVWLIESLTECAVKKTQSGGVATGKHAHVTDGLGYLQWFWFNRPRAPVKGGSMGSVVNMPPAQSWV